MRPFDGTISPQNVYEACLPYKLRYPYDVVKNGIITVTPLLFPAEERDNYVDEAQEIEIVTTYKLRPVIVISPEMNNTFLVLAITKVKEGSIDPKYLFAIADNKIVERHFLPIKRYPGMLKFNSLVLINAIYMISQTNVYYQRGRFNKEDFDGVRTKLGKIISQ